MKVRLRPQSRHLPAFILLALAEEPLHGGAILTALSDRIPRLAPDSAAVYRTLQQCEEDGEVVSEWDTSARGPARKRYRLTKAGWKKLDAWREDIEARAAALNYFLQTYEAIRKR
ncbi:MAG TPA: helix-turn-helix transcriptional regulator [Anaeromyxobacteraceae bacterium]|nr:helix-turn-helix transcriptional regulator [Anaeromyxobacteraceae bacterium]